MATTRKTVRRARKLRSNMSKPEVMLWRFLRKKPVGIKFRSQHPVAPYVLDFYCPVTKLAIEIDGISHDMGDRPMRDERRNQFLYRQGIETIRIPAQEVLDNCEGVPDRIVRYVQGLL